MEDNERNYNSFVEVVERENNDDDQKEKDDKNFRVESILKEIKNKNYLSRLKRDNPSGSNSEDIGWT